MRTTGIQIKWQWLITIPIGIALYLMLGCSFILAEDVEVVGVVKLSDNPTSGHGGVEVSNGHLTTTTGFDGSFVLEGEIFGDASFTVTFTKSGYDTSSFDVTVDYHDDNKPTNTKAVVDLGTVTLTKLTP